jgi:hypothetical protein
MSDPAPILGYRSPEPSDQFPDPYAGRKFALGVGVALAIVGFGFVIANFFSPGYTGAFVMLLLTPGVMLVTGLALIPSRTTRMVGAGVLAITGVALLLLAFLCAA